MVSAVGVALLTAAVLAGGSWPARALVAAVGTTWLAASLLPVTVLLHQGLLLVLLVTFPDRWPDGRVRWVLVASAVPVALLAVPQPGVAVLFAAAAAAALPGLRTDPAGHLLPVVGGAAVAAVLGGAWSISRLTPVAFDPSAALRAYELVLLGIAAGFALASRMVVASRAGLADRVLREDRPVDLDGLAEDLAGVLGDPGLRITRPDTGPSGAAGTERLEVRDGDHPVAVVWHRPRTLEDEAVRTAVLAAVRLVAVNLDRRQEVQARTEDLRRARDRVLTAADAQRAETAARLRSQVVAPLARTAAGLREDFSATADAREADAVEVTVGQLDAAVEDVEDLVAGVPPTMLGCGRLGAALAELVTCCPVPATLSAGTVSTDPAVETALFYVCSEALANVAKHAAATHVHIALWEDERSIGLSVTDDGRGDADARGAGLRGLADRLAAHGGRLQVQSPPGAGTALTATVPRQAIRR